MTLSVETPRRDDAAPSARSAPDLILVGHPNVGKSVIFGVLTGRYASVSNYPGTTVEVTRGNATAAGRRLTVIDTPGVNGLIPQSEEEQVTRDILLGEEGAVIQVGDEKNLARTLGLSLQLAEAGLPFLLCLNMGDEAEARGISVDAAGLASLLGVPVVRTVAVRRQGTQKLLRFASAARRSLREVRYPAEIEDALAEIEPILPPAPFSRRALGLMLLAGDASLAAWLNARVAEEDVAVIEAVRLRLERKLSRSVAFTINERRAQEAAALAGGLLRKAGRPPRRLAGALDTLTMHPLWGLPTLAAVLTLVFLFVGWLGAGVGVDALESGLFGKNLARLSLAVASDGAIETLSSSSSGEERLRLLPAADGAGSRAVEVVLEAADRSGEAGAAVVWQPVEGGRIQAFAGDNLRPLRAPLRETRPGTFEIDPQATGGPVELNVWSGFLNPAFYRMCRSYLPAGIPVDFLAGPYGLVTMGLTYAIAIILPIIICFFLAFSVLEDSGYLPRLAIVFNRAFRLVGLNGKAVLPMILGLGCGTMAALTTRILNSRKERVIAIFLLALGIPCSAQLGVILGLLAGLSLKASVLWVAVMLLTILAAGGLASRLVAGETSDFILEIPPLRVPALGNIALKTLSRVEWYLKEAVPLFLAGTAILFVLDRTGGLVSLRRGVEPIITGVLGLPAAASDAFILGFLRRDFGAAGLFRLADEGLMTPAQILVSVVTMTLFIPCVASFLMIAKERGLRSAALVAGIVFPYAFLVGGLLNFTLRRFGAGL